MLVRTALLAATLWADAQQPQRGTTVSITLPPAPEVTTLGPLVVSSGALDDTDLRELMRNGFPARLYYRVELWPASGLFRSLVSSAEWNVVVHYDALHDRYRVSRHTSDLRVTPLGDFKSLDSAERVVSAPYRAPLAPPGSRTGPYYYSVVMQVDALNFTDLDELTRWLSGDLTPTVRGRRNPFTFIARGVGQLVSSLLGGKTKRVEGRTGVFKT